MAPDSFFAYYASEAGIFTGSLSYPEAKDLQVADQASLQSIFQTTIQAPTPQDKKLASPIIRDKEEVITQIETTLDHMQKTNENLQNIHEKIESFNSSQEVLSLVQRGVTDMVLKGGASAAQSGLPFIVNFIKQSSDSLAELNSTTEMIKGVTDIFDSWGGVIGLIYQARLLQAAFQALSELKKQSHKLDPEQLFRLSQLEGRIKYEQSLMASIEAELTLRNARNVVSSATFALPWTTASASLQTGLTSMFDAIGQALSTLILSVYFHRARKDLKLVSSWSQNFKKWVEEKITITKETLKKKFGSQETNETVGTLMDQYLKKRAENRNSQIQALKDKLKRGELSMASIQERMARFEAEGLQNILGRLNVKDLDDDELASRLKADLSIAIEISPAFIQSIRTFYASLEGIKGSTTLSPEEKKQEVDGIKAGLSQHIQKGIATWMEKQSEDSLLNLYVDYHANVDLTVKNALTEVVQKQHKINEGFLSFKKNVLGIKLTIATIATVIFLALAITALVTTPLGPAALIIIIIKVIITVTPIVAGVGLAAAGYYYAYQYRPNQTVATLKGAYIKLFYYWVAANFHALKDYIGDYMTEAFRNKSAQVASSIGPCRLFGQSSMEATSGIDSTAIAKAQDEFQKAKSKAQEWNEKMERLKEDLEKIAWADFAKQAELRIAKPDAQSPFDSFDTLEAFNQALVHGDLGLLSEETKELLERQLGINIHSLQSEIAKDPLAVKKLLQKLFTLEEGDFVKFIGKQTHLKTA